jgi:ApbE family
MRKMAFAALGTTAVVRVTEAGALGEACSTLVDQLELLDRTCSRFRSDSELVRANARAGATIAVSPLLAELIEVSLAAAATTGGRVDPTLGAPLRNAGYDRTFSLVRDRDSWSFAERTVRPELWRRVELDTFRLTLRVPHGVELDLGAPACRPACAGEALRHKPIGGNPHGLCAIPHFSDCPVSKCSISSPVISQAGEEIGPPKTGHPYSGSRARCLPEQSWCVSETDQRRIVDQRSDRPDMALRPAGG